MTAPSRIAENVAEVRGRIADAAGRSGRTPDAITLVAVTKYVSSDVVRPLVEAGCCDLGESRPQQLWQKASDLADLPVRWHFIGHLQRNKVRRTVPLLTMIHSVDSLELLRATDSEMAIEGAEVAAGETSSFSASDRRQPRPSPSSPLPVLIEVHISGESAKQGIAPADLAAFLAAAVECRRVAIRGLMGMASLDGGLDAARREFASLRQLRDRLRPSCPAGVTLDELSMGMSGDFEAAIEEGATIVRVGSALFEGM